jgi:UDP-glucose 4-epimerase
MVPYERAYGDGFEELGTRTPDTTALRQLTGWEPRQTLDAAIEDVISYEQSRDVLPEASIATDAA